MQSLRSGGDEGAGCVHGPCGAVVASGFGGRSTGAADAGGAGAARAAAGGPCVLGHLARAVPTGNVDQVAASAAPGARLVATRAASVDLGQRLARGASSGGDCASLAGGQRGTPFVVLKARKPAAKPGLDTTNRQSYAREALRSVIDDPTSTSAARASAARTLAEIEGSIGRHQLAPGDRLADRHVSMLTRTELERELERLRASCRTGDSA